MSPARSGVGSIRVTVRKLLVIVAVLSSLAAGCGSATAWAAKVDGTTITQAELDRELEAILEAEPYLQAIEEQAGGSGVKGEGKGTLSTAYVATLLNARIAGVLVHDELERLGKEPSAEDLESARQRFEQQFQGGGSFGDEGQPPDPDQGKKIFESLPEFYRDYLVLQLAEFDVFSRSVQDAVTDADVREFYESNRELFQETCVSHILVETQAQAVDVLKRINGGADFAEIAKAESQDNGGGTGGSAAAGGSLGCLAGEEMSRLVAEFADATEALEPGQVSEPVRTQFGYHVIKVTERRTAALDDARVEIQQELAQPQTRLAELVKKSEIEVNPRYGTFVTEPQLRGVVPPDAPATSTTLPAGGIPLPPGQDGS